MKKKIIKTLKLPASCINCSKKLDEIKEELANEEMAICPSCVYCKDCKMERNKKEEKIRGNKTNKTKICKKCCTKCEECDKVMLTYDWPRTIIMDGMCKKCYSLCKECMKFVMNEKAITQDDDGKIERTCIKCYQIENKPDTLDNKYKIVLKRLKDGTNKFIRWKKTKSRMECESCGKKFLNKVSDGKKKCNVCVKKGEKLNTKKEFLKKNPDPTDNHNKYVLNGQDGVWYGRSKELKWIKVEERKFCENCFTSFWIPVDNVLYGFTPSKMNINSFVNPISTPSDMSYHFIRCELCKPDDGDKKWSWDCGQKKWIIIKSKMKCGSCGKKKWYTPEQSRVLTKKNNNEFNCLKCSKKNKNNKLKN